MRHKRAVKDANAPEKADRRLKLCGTRNNTPQEDAEVLFYTLPFFFLFPLLFILFCFVLFCFVLFCFVLFCFVLFCFVLFCFVLFCFVLFCFVLFLCYFNSSYVGC